MDLLPRFILQSSLTLVLMLHPLNPETKYLLVQTSFCRLPDSQTRARKVVEGVVEAVLAVDVAADVGLLLVVASVAVAPVVALLAEALEAVVLLVVSVGAAARLAEEARVDSAEVVDVDASKWLVEFKKRKLAAKQFLELPFDLCIGNFIL